MPADLLRVYDPAECDSDGAPLDWERCRTCRGYGKRLAGLMGRGEYERCSTCAGHGSLKAATLARRWDLVMGCGHSPVDPPRAYRCEDCGHPTSEGTWEGGGPINPTHMQHTVPLMLGIGREPEFTDDDGNVFRPVHYSPCDKWCHHGGPGRWEFPRKPGEIHQGVIEGSMAEGSVGRDVARGVSHEASWRQVDVRTLGWPHDLRPERLAILCLRCWAGRSEGAR